MSPGYFQKHSDKSLTCTLCPHNCRIKNNRFGSCGVRQNYKGAIESKVYGVVSALNLDPIEKKPLYHYFPGSKILSVGSYGCNLKCNFCQNHQISQVNSGRISPGAIKISPEDISKKAKSMNNNIGVAFTYNEPIVWFEFMRDTASQVKMDGMNTVMISNGYINREPLLDLLPYIDAFNIDLKAFDDRFYSRETGGTLAPVLESLKIISKSGKHLEITMLVIEGLNDDPVLFKEMIEWIYNNCGPDCIIHLSKYFPNYHSERPLTPDRILLGLYKIAKKRMHFTYLGNTQLAEGSNTICPECSAILIERKGYSISRVGINKNGHCTECSARILEYSTFS